MRWWGLDVRSRRRRRWALSGFYAVLFVVFAGVGTTSRWTAHPYIVLLSLVVAAAVLGRLSILGKRGPMRDRERPALRLGKIEYVSVSGLDERARYRFGLESFDAASEAQKNELLNTHWGGTRYMPNERDKTLWLDEREQRDWDSAERWALQQVIKILGILTGIWLSEMARYGKLDGYSVVTLLLYVGLAAMTLPKARVLWTEVDPRELGGELAVVGGVEA